MLLGVTELANTSTAFVGFIATCLKLRKKLVKTKSWKVHKGNAYHKYLRSKVLKALKDIISRLCEALHNCGLFAVDKGILPIRVRVVPIRFFFIIRHRQVLYHKLLFRQSTMKMGNIIPHWLPRSWAGIPVHADWEHQREPALKSNNWCDWVTQGV